MIGIGETLVVVIYLATLTYVAVKVWKT